MDTRRSSSIPFADKTGNDQKDPSADEYMPRKSNVDGGITSGKISADKYADFAKERGVHAEGRVMRQATDNDFMDALEEKSGISKVRSTKKYIVIISALIIFLMIFAAVSYATMKSGSRQTVKTPVDNGANMKAAFTRMKNLKSYAYDGKINIDVSFKKDGAVSGGSNFQFSCNGISDRTDEQNPAYYSNIIYARSSGQNDMKSRTALNVESTKANQKEYLKINDFQISDPHVDAAASNLQNVLKDVGNVWYEIGPQDEKNFSDSILKYFSLPGGIADGKNLSGGNAAYIDGIFTSYNLLGFIKDLGNEKIDGVDVLHYKVDINTKEALSLMADSLQKKINSDGGDAEEQKILDELRSSASDGSQLRELADYALSGTETEIWIGKDDQLIRRIHMSAKFDKSFALKLAAKVKALYGDKYDVGDDAIPDFSLGFDLDYSFSGFDTSRVNAPGSAKDFKEVMDRMNSLTPVSVNASGTDAIDSDNDGLSDEREKFYGSDPRNPDSDGDGYKDGDEVKNGYDPVIAGSARLDFGKIPK